MSEELTTPDLVALMRSWIEAANRRDVDAAASFYAPDAVYQSVGMGASFEGVAAIREFLGDFVGAYDEFGVEAEEILDLGNGVTLAVVDQKGRPHGSSGEVQMRYATVAIWVESMIERFTSYTDIDEGRAAAERLAEERGEAMSENLDLVRSIYAEWERGDYRSTAWAHPAIEYVIADGPAPGSWTALAQTTRVWQEWLDAWADFRVEAEGYRELDDERVVSLVRFRGRAKSSGVEIAEMYAKGAGVFHVRDGKVVKLVLNWERDRALADLGLAE